MKSLEAYKSFMRSIRMMKMIEECTNIDREDMRKYGNITININGLIIITRIKIRF